MNKSIRNLLLGAASGLLMMQIAHADSFTGIHPLQTSPLVMTVGAFGASIDSGVELERTKTGNGTSIDLEDDLNFDDSDTLPTFLLNWRITNRSRVSLEYLTVGQGNSGQARRDITWDGVEYEAGVKLKSNMDLDVGRLFFGYSLLKDDRKEIGLGLGLHYLAIDSAIAGEARIDGVPVGRVERGFDDWAVLPNIGFYANYALSSKWLINARIDWISADIGDYDGTLWNNEAAIQYQMFDNVGIGLAYRYMSFDIAADKSNKYWAIDLDYGGPLLFLTVNF